MGTDIHLTVEVKEREIWNNAESRLPRWQECWRCDGTGKELRWVAQKHVETGKACEACEGTGKLAGAYRDRNYRLFAVLAGVRNGYGFAGVPTFTPIVPIAEPRGLPEDMDPKSREALSDEHTQSWLTLAEIERYLTSHEEKRVTATGVIPLTELAAFEATPGAPKKGWSGGIMGQGIVTYPNPTAAKIAKARGEAPSPGPNGEMAYVQVEWTESFLDDFLPETFRTFLEHCRDLHDDSECVRFVFDFDS